MSAPELPHPDAFRGTPYDTIDALERRFYDRSFLIVDKTFTRAFGPENAPLSVALEYAGANDGHGRVAFADIGCGTGNTVRTFTDSMRYHHPDAEVTAVGLNKDDYRAESMSRATRERIFNGELQYDIGVAEAMPYPSGLFNLVIAHEVLIYTPRPDMAIDEMARIATPGGHLFFNLLAVQVHSRSSFANRSIGRLAAADYEIDDHITKVALPNGQRVDRVCLHVIKPGEAEA